MRAEATNSGVIVVDEHRADALPLYRRLTFAPHDRRVSEEHADIDAGKKINGTKRHIAVDALGLLLTVLVTAASVQDCDAARPLLWNLRRAFPSIKLTWADGGYAGKLVTGQRSSCA